MGALTGSASTRAGLRFPTIEDWHDWVSEGLRTDGCSHSPDTIWWLEIGCSGSRGIAYPPLPCTLHDARYGIGGSEEDRLKADYELYFGMLELIDQGTAWLRWPRRARASKYLAAVREFGSSRWKYT